MRLSGFGRGAAFLFVIPLNPLPDGQGSVKKRDNTNMGSDAG
jgi:hypothetical protein